MEKKVWAWERGREACQQGPGWLVTLHPDSGKQGEAVTARLQNLKAHPQWYNSFSEVPPAKGSMVFPNSSYYGELSVGTQDPMKDNLYAGHSSILDFFVSLLLLFGFVRHGPAL